MKRLVGDDRADFVAYYGPRLLCKSDMSDGELSTMEYLIR